MDIPAFDMDSIAKNMNVMIISDKTTKNILHNNIITKIKTKYSISRTLNYHEIPIHTNTHISDASDCILTIFADIKNGYQYGTYITLLDRMNFHNHILSCTNLSYVPIDAPIIFIYDEKIESKIKLIYDNYVNRHMYSFEYVFEIFQKYDTIVIANKLLMRYDIEQPHMDVNIYYDNLFSNETVTNLAEQIVKNKGLYHLPNMTLHRCLLSRINILKKYHNALYFLMNYECYVNINMPLEMCHIILKFLILLCEKNETKDDTLRLCIDDYDNSNYYYWKAIYSKIYTFVNNFDS